MIVGKNNFLFLSKQTGTTKDGEKYLSFVVIDSSDVKHSFLTTDPKLIDELKQKNFAKYSDVVLVIGFQKEYNQNRYSYWQAELLGVE